jgi:hypothetical protein
LSLLLVGLHLLYLLLQAFELGDALLGLNRQGRELLTILDSRSLSVMAWPRT